MLDKIEEHNVNSWKKAINCQFRALFSLNVTEIEIFIDIDMICQIWQKWDIISCLISLECSRYYIISYIPIRDIISDIISQRYISYQPLHSSRAVMPLHMFLRFFLALFLIYCLQTTNQRMNKLIR